MPTTMTMEDGPPPAPATVVWRQSFASAPETKDQVVLQVLQVLVGQGWLGEDDRIWLQLCLDEAIVNAMVHGNEADRTALVTILVGTRGDRWLVQVEDQGDGFDLARVPDPEGDDCLTREHGRGIRLLREWLDRMAYFRGGSVLVMERRIDPV